VVNRKFDQWIAGIDARIARGEHLREYQRIASTSTPPPVPVNPVAELFGPGSTKRTAFNEPTETAAQAIGRMRNARYHRTDGA
jgi:hypothetical protein